MELRQVVNSRSKPWYKHWWGIILVILIWPIFLLWFTWAKAKWPQLIKIGSSVVLSILIFLSACFYAGTYADMKQIISTTNTAATSSKTNPAATPANNTSQTTPSQPAPTPTPPPTQPAIKEQVTTWRDKYGYILQTLATDLKNGSTDVNNNSALLADCIQQQTDVATAQKFPAIPDAQTANDWSSALTYLATGAQDCIAGAVKEDDTLLSQATDEYNQSATKMKATSTDLQAITDKQ